MTQNKIIENHEPARILSLDGLRGLCILVVVFHNLYPYSAHAHVNVESAVRLFANMGWVGVQWFFVLSGFLITGILLKLKSKADGLKIFYIRRTLRIFPLYYATLILFLLLLPLFGYHTERIQNLQDHQAWYWLYINNWTSAFGVDDQGFPHLWSLAVEEQFYLVWPWLIFYLPEAWVLGICGFFIVSAPVIREYIAICYPEEQVKTLAYQLTIVRWDALAMGAVFAMAMHIESFKQKLFKALPFISLAVLVSLLITIAINHSFAPVGQGEFALHQTLAALLGVILLNEALNEKGLLKGRMIRFFQNGFLQHLGKHSYAIYIFHLIVGFVFWPMKQSLFAQFPNFNPVLEEYLFFAFDILVAYFAALISWYILEKPFLSLKKYYPAA